MPQSKFAQQIKTIDVLTGICAAVLVADVGIIYASVVVSPIPGNEARWFDEVLRRFAGVGISAVFALGFVIWLRLRRRAVKERWDADDAERLFRV